MTLTFLTLPSPFHLVFHLMVLVSYTGVFEGNGHTIKGLVMNTMGNQGLTRAGVFCGLEGANFENLVFDSSCSFSGYFAGALGVSLTGSLTATNVTNKAAVSGSYGVGGFVGTVQRVGQIVEVTFKGCVNDGNITGQGEIGGFVGAVQYTDGLTVSFSDCINNANITGQFEYVGGFVGYVMSNSDMEMSISNCTNNGNVTGGSNGIGGFIGFCVDNRGISVVVSNCTNNGIVIGGGHSVGGFVGIFLHNTQVAITISNCANDGSVIGSSKIGGLTGGFYRNTGNDVNISNCEQWTHHGERSSGWTCWGNYHDDQHGHYTFQLHQHWGDQWN